MQACICQGAHVVRRQFQVSGVSLGLPFCLQWDFLLCTEIYNKLAGLWTSGFSWYHRSPCYGSNGILNHATEPSFPWIIGIWYQTLMLVQWMLCLLSYPAQEVYICQLKDTSSYHYNTASNTYKKHLSDRCLQEKWVLSPGPWFSISQDIWDPSAP